MNRLAEYLIVALGLFFSLGASPAAVSQTIENGQVRVTFDKKEGRLSARKADGQILFTGCISAVIHDGEVYPGDGKNYSFKATRVNQNSRHPELIITGRDRKRQLDFVNRISLLPDTPSVQFEVIYKNVSGQDLPVNSVVPMRLIPAQGGSLHFQNAAQCMTNGPMYYDAGMLHDLAKPYVKPEPYGETKGGVPRDHALSADVRTVQSWWNLAVFDPNHQQTLALGYLRNRNSLGRLQLLKVSENELSLIAESVFNPGFVLKKSHEISSDKFVLIWGNDPYSVLEVYADLMAGEIKKPATQIVNGWCNWFYTMDVFDETEILRNAELAARELKPYGLEYIQIDEGFQTLHGEWQGNARFPHGLKWLGDRIKALGLKPGIWIAPFVISENTRLFNQHPECLVKDADGQPVRIGPWPSENTEWYRNETPKRYCLDITHPLGERWFTSLIDTVVNTWGFEMIKVDFVSWTVFSANRFYDAGATPAQVYQKAMRIMRTIAGEKCHILDCGPGNISGEFINSLRIEYDQFYGPDAAWTQYFGGTSCSAGAAGKRYFYHNKIWTNDIDHVCLDVLSLPKAQAAATLIGLSGGNVMSGDRLLNLDPTRMEILKKIFPATIEAARPVDLCENDPQTIFAGKITRDFGQWDVVAFFNPDLKQSLTRKLPLHRLWLDDTKTYLAFDFWNETFAGEITQNIEVTVNPGNVALFALREKTAYPQIIGTNRHVKQGAVELVTARFDTATQVFSATSVSPAGSAHSIFIYQPTGYSWLPRDSKIFEYHPNYTIRTGAGNLIRVDVQFAEKDTVLWVVEFTKK